MRLASLHGHLSSEQLLQLGQLQNDGVHALGLFSPGGKHIVSIRDDLTRHCQVEAKSGRLREMTAWV